MAKSSDPKLSTSSMRRILRRFWPHIRKQRVLVGGSFLALIAEVGLRLLEPWPLKLILDRVITTTPTEGTSGIGFVDSMSSETLLALAAASVVLVTGLRAFTAYISTVGFALAGSRIVTEVRGELYAHLQRLSLSFHSKARTGDLISRLTGDMNRLQEATVTAALPLTGHVMTMTGMVLVMFVLNYRLALIAVLAYPLVLLSMTRFSKSIHKVARAQREREGALAATAGESLGAIKVVQALSLEGILERAFTAHNSASLQQGVRAARLSAGLERSVDLLIAFGTALVLWYGARLVMQGTITPGDLIVFITYMKNAVRPMRDLAKYTARLAKATAAGERVIDVLDEEPEVKDRPNAVPAPPLRGEIRFENVYLTYQDREPVLRDISLHVLPGQHVAFVGPSGAGKSSLAGLLLRLYDPTAGQVSMDERNIRRYTLESVRAQISVVLQESVLFAVSVRENISYGFPQATNEDIEAAARLANAHDFIMRMPRGYDTVLSERGATLSGGERQRIAIARAALRDAPIVILDEPTSGLDSENAQAVNEALERLMQGRTAFIIAHDLATVQEADTIAYIERGRIVEQGRHAQLIEMGGRYAAMHELQRSTGERPERAPEHTRPAPASARQLTKTHRFTPKGR